MPEYILPALLLILAALRVKSFLRLWKAPHLFGADKCFGLPLPPVQAGPLIRRYRRALCVPLAAEAVVVAGLLAASGWQALVYEQPAAFVAVAVLHSLTAVHFVRLVKERAAGDGVWQPSRAVALSLRVRRLADYTSVPFETTLALVTGLALGLLAYDYHAWAESGEMHEGLAEFFALPLLFVYMQLGGLLLKHGLVRLRQWLPGERTEAFLRWREEALRYYVWGCDGVRALWTFALAYVALHAHFGDDRDRVAWDRVRIAAVLVLAVLLAATFGGLVRHRRRMTALRRELEPVEAFASPPRLLEADRYYLGGLIYYNAENPAVFVVGPRAVALNVAQARAYLYAAYMTGLVLLVLWNVTNPG